MPVTYQQLGNSGGGMVDLKITTFPKTEVNLQGNKVARTLVSDDQGIAIFKRLKGGAYTVTAGGKEKEIVLTTEYNVPLTWQIKDMEIGSKIKFSNGKKFILMAKEMPVKKDEPRPANSACFVSEFIVDTYTMYILETYFDSAEWKNKINAYYEELSPFEKSAVLPRLIRGEYKDNWKTEIVHFYMPSDREMGVVTYSNNQNLGFNDDASRIKRTERGEPMAYYLRTQYADGSTSLRIGAVSKTGMQDSSDIGGWIDQHKLPKTGGLVLECDISLDAYIVPDSDGYYRILGM